MNDAEVIRTTELGLRLAGLAFFLASRDWHGSPGIVIDPVSGWYSAAVKLGQHAARQIQSVSGPGCSGPRYFPGLTFSAGLGTASLAWRALPPYTLAHVFMPAGNFQVARVNELIEQTIVGKRSRVRGLRPKRVSTRGPRTPTGPASK